MAKDERDPQPVSERAVSRARPDPRIGSCARCEWIRVQQTNRGSVFYRCARADEDETYLRYPLLPVRGCRGFEPVSE